MKKRAFSLLEFSISAFLLLLVLSLLLPNIEMFRRSYVQLDAHTKRRKEKIEFQVLMRQLFEHSIPFVENTKEAYFVFDFPKATWIRWNLETIEGEGKEVGDSLLLQCIFLDDTEIKQKVFVLYFRQKNLYLAYYRMGYFQEGDSLCLLSEVEGRFRREGKKVILEYRDRKNGKEEKIYYSK